MELVFKHLELIQKVIERMSKNSFMLKTWTLSLVVGLVGLSTTINERTFIVSVSLVPIIIFWILDTYFLQQEKLYRVHYDNVRKMNENEIDFSMDVSIPEGKAYRFIIIMFSKTIVLFYLPLLVMLLSLLIYIAICK